MANRLINETSPYLLQHAHNPVDWYAWSAEALERAAKADKLILLSIGYSACHWCHVMEHESFENPSIAQVMNQNFVNIKVDREERPDLEQIYMSAVQIMTGSGGWPLTIFLLPNGEPIFGGTYFPPEDRYNRPGFLRVLETIAEAYRTRRAEIMENAKSLREHLTRPTFRKSQDEIIDTNLLDMAYRTIASRFDSREGGFGSAPKFPPSMSIDFLLRYSDRTGSEQALHMATLTLDKMAYGGMYDQVGGGFHRYSTDDRWLVPHFEKMLYDNALLVRAYVDAHRVTGKPLYKRIVEETLDFVVREMRGANGAFYSTQDADSEGIEGKFYVWALKEFSEVTGADAELVAKYFGVTEQGNFEEQNILNVSRDLELFSKLERIPVQELETTIEATTRIMDRMIQSFWDTNNAGFYFTGGNHESLITRPKDFFDNATPSGNSVAADVLLRLAAVTGRNDYREKAELIIHTAASLLRQYASGFGRMLAAVDFYAGPSKEIAIAGAPDAFLPLLRRGYFPRAVIAAGAAADRIALLRDRPLIDGKPTVYVCENFMCKQPVVDLAALEEQLKE